MIPSEPGSKRRTARWVFKSFSFANIGGRTYVAVVFAGAGEARAPAAVVNSIRESQLVIIAPSNPITSLGPILAIHDIRDALRCTRAEVVAISPLIGDTAFSGAGCEADGGLRL